ncbi:glycosyltransferase family 4 protein [Tranquillimonas rosea]|uniref:glycosyltransferase family 4 protein n=1 Tax=Tranquillimonas rosea TaxID=641238 RepID=UPI003BABFB6F
MKLLVFAHRLELGGTQINAIDLAAFLRDRRGVDVTVHATEGPALELLRARGLPFIPAPDVRLHPSPARIRALRDTVCRVRPDIIQAWDWWQGLEAYCGVHLPEGVPLVITDMMMHLTRAMPRGVPTTFGFEGLRRQAEAAGWSRTALLPPPVDTEANAPGASDGAALRRRLNVGGDAVLLVSVSRLSEYMKSESIKRTIEVVRELGDTLPLTYLIVGDGAAMPRIRETAGRANAALGREAISLAGAMTDPRPAYAAADIVLGMGGSSLRGLAFGKPVVVTGEAGFARLFSPETAEGFIETGMFGHGAGGADNAALSGPILALARSPDLRTALGAFGREFVVANHGIEVVGDTLLRVCRSAVGYRPGRVALTADAARAAYFYLRERRFRVASRDAVERG